MSGALAACNPAIQCCLPALAFQEFPYTLQSSNPSSFELASPPLETAEGSGSLPWFAQDISGLPGLPIVVEEGPIGAECADEGSNWLEMSADDLQLQALHHHRLQREQELASFAAEIDYFTGRTQPGVIYSVSENRDLLPAEVRRQIGTLASLDPRGVEGLAFSWTWREGLPDVTVFRPEAETQMGVVFNEADGEIYLVQNPPAEIALAWDPSIDQMEVRALSFDPTAWETGSDVVYTIAADGSLVPSIAAPELPSVVELVDAANGETRPVLALGLDRATDESGEGGIVGDDGLLVGSSIFGAGFLRQAPPPGVSGPRAGLPVSRMFYQGAIGTGIFLGIHYSVVEGMGVPDHISPYIDTTFMVGGFAAIDSTSAWLSTEWATSQTGRTFLTGSVGRQMFPNGRIPQLFGPRGIQWGHIAQATPFVFEASIGNAYALDAVGCEFGSTCNTVGNIALTTGEYVGVGTTTHLLWTANMAQNAMAIEAAGGTLTPEMEAALQFARNNPRIMAFAESFPRTAAAFTYLGDSYAYATAGTLATGEAALAPQIITIGGRGVTLGVGVGGTGGGVFLAEGLAGGAGVGGIALQTLMAGGAVILGNWVGGGIVEIWKWASGYNDDPEGALIDFTWDYMNREVAGGFLNTLFGAVIKGIQSVFISDEVYEGMEIKWDQWVRSLNGWGDAVGDAVLVNALLSVDGTGFESGEVNLGMNRTDFDRLLRQLFQNDQEAADGTTFQESLDAVYGTNDNPGMYDRIRPTHRGSRDYSGGPALNANIIAIQDNVSQRGSISGRARTRRFVSGLVERSQESGRLHGHVETALTGVRQYYLQRMVGVGLAEMNEAGEAVPLPLGYEDLNDDQMTFLFGGREVYQRVTAGEITDPAEIQSESIMLQNRIRALEYLLGVTAPNPGTSQPEAADLLFASR